VASQFLDEVKLLFGKLDGASYSPFPSTLLSSDNATLEKYLKSKSSAISSAILQLFSSSTGPTPEVTELQARIAQLLAAEKSYINELQRVRLERDQMEERLETASMRYMVAEKKLDRAKSITVAKLERQATAGGRSEAGSGLGGGVDGCAVKSETGANQGDNSEAVVVAEAARRAAMAASEKQREQIEQLQAENEKLAAQVTSLNGKLTHLSDEDYAQTDLFKLIRSQHEDSIRQINDLEAVSSELREEADRLRADREVYRAQLEAEMQAAISEKDSLLGKAESDVARIRAARDELHAEVQMRKAAQDQERASISQIRELSASKDERIKILESELERHRISVSQPAGAPLADGDVPVEELRNKYTTLERQYAMLNQELSSMGAAYKKASAEKAQKVHNLSSLEDKVVRLGVEKSKADQKYFAAMKAKETREQEIRTLRAQNSKSSDIVATLKDAQESTRLVVDKLEKQVVELESALANATNQQRSSQRQITEKGIYIDGLRKQVDELKALLGSKDGACSAASNSQRKAEVEVERLRTDLEETQKRLESWKTKGLGDENEHYEVLRVSHRAGNAEQTSS
jgi:E3 ubiquitin-protein ligase BRE1